MTLFGKVLDSSAGAPTPISGPTPLNIRLKSAVSG